VGGLLAVPHANQRAVECIRDAARPVFQQAEVILDAAAIILVRRGIGGRHDAVHADGVDRRRRRHAVGQRPDRKRRVRRRGDIADDAPGGVCLGDPRRDRGFRVRFIVGHGGCHDGFGRDHAAAGACAEDEVDEEDVGVERVLVSLIQLFERIVKESAATAASALLVVL